MTKQTVSNMDLMITQMVKQMDRENYKPLKALSHSYETLLNNLSGSHEDFKDHKLTENIKTQLKYIEKLNNELQSKSIPELLRADSYHEVNHLTTTTARLQDVVRGLNSMLIALYKNYNRKVLIVSESQNISEELMRKLIDKNNESIVENSLRGRTGSITYTDKNSYSAITFSENYRGKRMDFAYIDKALDTEKINLTLTNLKDQSNYKLFLNSRFI